MEQTRIISENLTVLVVEDNATITSVIVAMLKHTLPSTTSIVVASNLHEAFKMLHRHAVGVILLDLTLPDSSGLETIARIRVKTGAPLVVLTGQEDESFALEALKAGANDYLIKGELSPKVLSRSLNYAIERHRHHLSAAERLRLFEQREDFMATLTHDLKNPLIGSNRILELIADGSLGSLNEQQSKLLLKLRDSNNNLLSMIRNLVDVYRYEKNLDQLHPQDTDICELIKGYVESVSHLVADKDLDIVFNCSPGVVVPVDPNSMLRVIQNLVENALKFTPNRGKIDVKVWRENDSVLFQVKDTGPGIAPEEHSKLFQRFFQGRRGQAYRHGMGLGLYLSRQIVEAHCGSIWCHTEEFGGTTFTVSLPLTPASFSPPAYDEQGVQMGE